MMPPADALVMPVACAPKKAPCPHCGKPARRVRRPRRYVRTTAYKQVAYLHITYGEYRAQALLRFSGTLCVDEVHLGDYTLLLATDPLGDFPVAFALVSQNDQGHMRRFLGNLKTWGLKPAVVVTDGSNLYPALLAEL